MLFLYSSFKVDEFFNVHLLSLLELHVGSPQQFHLLFLSLRALGRSGRGRGDVFVGSDGEVCVYFAHSR